MQTNLSEQVFIFSGKSLHWSSLMSQNVTDSAHITIFYISTFYQPAIHSQ